MVRDSEKSVGTPKTTGPSGPCFTGPYAKPYHIYYPESNILLNPFNAKAKKKKYPVSHPLPGHLKPPLVLTFFSFFPSAPRYPLEAVEFSCGSVMIDHMPNDSSEEHILSKVFVRKDINCLNPIEIPYYSSGIFPLICTNCAGDTDFVKGAQADAYYPICTGCWDSHGKVLKRKRKLFKEK